MRGFLNYALIHCALLGWPAFAQMTTPGTNNGTVMDPSGRAVPGASVTIINGATKDVRSLTSGEGGEFNFTAIVPGSYSLKAERSGFKTLERTGVVVSANERVSLGELQLQLGSVGETVTVAADAVHVETNSAELSADITTQQLGSLTTRGREVVSLLRTIPGVAYQADQDSAGGTYGTSTPSIRGASANMNIDS